MSIKPIELQVMIPRTSNISKMNSDEQNKLQMLQQQNSLSVKHKNENDVKQVHSQDKPHEARIKDKEEKNGNSRGKEGKRNKGRYGRNKNINAEERSTTIDIRL